MSFHCVSALFPRALLLQSLAGTTAPPPGSRELRRCGSVRFGGADGSVALCSGREGGRPRSSELVRSCSRGPGGGGFHPGEVGQGTFWHCKELAVAGGGGEWGAIMKKIAHCDQKSLKTSFTSGMRCNEGALRSEDPSWLLL